MKCGFCGYAGGDGVLMKWACLWKASTFAFCICVCCRCLFCLFQLSNIIWYISRAFRNKYLIELWLMSCCYCLSLLSVDIRIKDLGCFVLLLTLLNWQLCVFVVFIGLRYHYHSFLGKITKIYISDFNSNIKYQSFHAKPPYRSKTSDSIN